MEMLKAFIMLIILSFGTALIVEQFYIPEKIKPFFLLILGLLFGQLLRIFVLHKY